MIKSFSVVETRCCSKCQFFDLDTNLCVLVRCVKASVLLITPKEGCDDLPF